ncbi:transposase [Cylindrospermum stagnale PCC 7417]|uniref:Transposase n=1 Tax=Cylindrospermum stagnale PCC 7417 TaxID=56107 RepID=K9X4U2_9NOST|nr:transposase [Cylindrospermum stagnale]AFZ27114.1 transposase [Cylindrospermum stagnale PCC 7417]
MNLPLQIIYKFDNMENHTKSFYRRSLRLRGYDYSQAGAYFITICTNKRKCLFGNIANNEVNLNELGNIVLDFWYSLPSKYPNIELDEFIIMPNHLHGIIVITDLETIYKSHSQQLTNVGTIHELSLRERRNILLPKVIGYFKMNAAKAINQKISASGTSLWQGNYYEHIVRNESELERIRQYIVNNPLKWALDCDNPDGKPDQEELLFWRDFGRKDL